MLSAVRAAVVLVMLVTATVAHADDATPEQRAKARELGEAALRKMSDGDNIGAADLFKRAYQTSHEIPYLVNAGVAQRQAKLPQEAVATFKRCLEEGGMGLAPDVREQIAGDIQKLVNESGQLNVRTEIDFADVLLDGRRVGTTTKASPLFLLVAPDLGREQKLVARRDGYYDAERVLESLSVGTPVDIVLTPKPIPKTATLTVESIPTGAQLTGFSRTPQTLELPPGDHTITATMSGHEPAVQTVHLEVGEARKLTLSLREIAPSWWEKHKLKVLIGIGVAVVTAGVIVAYYGFKPNYGQRFDYP